MMDHYDMESYRLEFAEGYSKVLVLQGEDLCETYQLTTAGQALSIQAVDGEYVMGMVDRPAKPRVAMDPLKSNITFNGDRLGGTVIIDFRDFSMYKETPNPKKSVKVEFLLACCPQLVWNVVMGKALKVRFENETCFSIQGL